MLSLSVLGMLVLIVALIWIFGLYSCWQTLINSPTCSTELVKEWSYTSPVPYVCKLCLLFDTYLTSDFKHPRIQALKAARASFTVCPATSCLTLDEYIVYRYLDCTNGSAAFGQDTAPQSREVLGSIPRKVLGNFKVTYSFWPLSVFSTQSLTEMSTKEFSLA